MISERLADSNAGVSAAASSSEQAATPAHGHDISPAAAGDLGSNPTAAAVEQEPSAAAQARPSGRLLDTQLHRSDLVNRKPVRVKREGEDIVCVLADGTVYAFRNRCPHTGYLMHEGRVRGCVVTCISHLAQFDMRDGHVVALPMEGRSIETGPLTIYRVVEQDGAIFVELPGD
jgi:nitrite reductase/ring-hydroxylating ferredoxin subunit